MLVAVPGKLPPLLSFPPPDNADDGASTHSVLTVFDSSGQALPGILGKAIDSQLAADMRRQFEADDESGRDEYLNAMRVVTGICRQVSSRCSAFKFAPW